MLLATGSIHPESGGWYLDGPVELRYADGHWTIIIRDSQFHVVVDGQPPEDLATFRNEVAAVVQGCLDASGFCWRFHYRSRSALSSSMGTRSSWSCVSMGGPSSIPNSGDGVLRYGASCDRLVGNLTSIRRRD
jgi:hypothetical protein